MADGDFELAKELAAELGIEVPDHEHLTDKANARLFAALHGDKLQYCYPEKDFYWWDGRRWSKGGTKKAELWVRDIAPHYYEIAAGLGRKITELNNQAKVAAIIGADPQEIDQQTKKFTEQAKKSSDMAKAYTSWGKKSESSERMAAAVRWVRSLIPVEPIDMDRDPWLLNCLNGTIDLRTGELRDHRMEDLITKLCPVEYDPDAKFLLWDQFLERVQPTLEMRGFLKRAAGYTATGLTIEEKLFFCYGDTATGKSTFLQAVRMSLGDYATTSQFDAFLQNDRSSTHLEHIARLAGARMVVSIEVDEGQRLAEALVKHITGGEEVAASFKYGNTFNFMPAFQLWLAANHRPRVRADDNAIWRRILQLPFDVTIPEQERDPGVKSTLIDVEVAGPAILAWIVQGCLEWQQVGLLPPTIVHEATTKYREEMDPLIDFLEEKCEKNDEVKGADNGNLYRAYEEWAKEAGVRRPLGRKSFTQALQANGFKQIRDGKMRYWPGLVISGAPAQKAF